MSMGFRLILTLNSRMAVILRYFIERALGANHAKVVVKLAATKESKYLVFGNI